MLSSFRSMASESDEPRTKSSSEDLFEIMRGEDSECDAILKAIWSRSDSTDEQLAELGVGRLGYC